MEIGNVVTVVYNVDSNEKLQETVYFYTTTLRFRKISDTPVPDKYHSVVLTVPHGGYGPIGAPFQLLLIRRWNDSPTTFHLSKSQTSIEISCSNVPEMAKRLDAAGVKYELFEAPAINSLVFDDPLGNRLVLRQKY